MSKTSLNMYEGIVKFLGTYKNIYFHHLSMYRRSFKKDGKQADKLKKLYLEVKDKQRYLDLINEEAVKQHNSLPIDDEFGRKTLEILSYDEKYMFAKIAKYQDIITVDLRNKKTFETKPIDKDPDQELEIFTYFLIDRSNFVISFLKEQSAPSIIVLDNLIYNYFKKDNIFGEVSGVVIEDAIPILKKKKLIGTIDYKMKIPKEKYISLDELGITQKDFLKLRNQDHVEINVRLVAKRNKSAFKDGNGIENILGKILKKTNKVSVKAKGDGEYMQKYNIVDSLMTKRTKFEFDRNAESIKKEIFSQLRHTYETNKDEIVQYVNKE